MLRKRSESFSKLDRIFRIGRTLTHGVAVPRCEHSVIFSFSVGPGACLIACGAILFSS